MAVYEALLLNTVVPQIQAAQAGDSYVMVVNATTPALRITQTGTGDSILVEDAANPDSSPFVVTAGGDVGIGATTPAYKLDVQGGLARSQNSGGINNGYLITTNSSNAAARNWAVLSNSNAFGDFVIRQGNSLGSDPVSGTDRLVIDASGNLGLGVTPSGWSSSVAAQVGYGAALSSRAAGNTASDMTHGAYWNGTNWLHQYSSVGAGRYQMTGANAGSTHAWFVSAGGTANNTISFTQAMTLDASGRLLIGTTSSTVYYNSTQTYTASAVLKTNVSNEVTDLVLINGNNDFGSTLDFARTNTSSNDVRFGLIGGVPTSNTAGSEAGYVYFATKGTADTNVVERARITSGGDFYFGVAGTNSGVVYIQTGTGTGGRIIDAIDALGARYFEVQTDGDVYNTNGTYGTISDQKMKTDIVDAGSQWADIKALRFRKFKMKNDPSNLVQLGVVAQEVELTLSLIHI